jgi:hypothetical protein
VGRKQTSELRELLRAVVATGLTGPTDRLPQSARGHHSSHSFTGGSQAGNDVMTIDTLPDDGAPQRVTVRPARMQDMRLIQAYIRSLSPASRRNRFLGPCLSGRLPHSPSAATSLFLISLTVVSI